MGSNEDKVGAARVRMLRERSAESRGKVFIRLNRRSQRGLREVNWTLPRAAESNALFSVRKPPETCRGSYMICIPCICTNSYSQSYSTIPAPPPAAVRCQCPAPRSRPGVLWRSRFIWPRPHRTDPTGTGGSAHPVRIDFSCNWAIWAEYHARHCTGPCILAGHSARVLAGECPWDEASGIAIHIRRQRVGQSLRSRPCSQSLSGCRSGPLTRARAMENTMNLL